MFTDAATEDFFRVRLDHMIDLRHALEVLASRMPWQQIEALVAHLFSRKANPAAAGGIRGWRLDADKKRAPSMKMGLILPFQNFS